MSDSMRDLIFAFCRIVFKQMLPCVFVCLRYVNDFSNCFQIEFNKRNAVQCVIKGGKSPGRG